MRFFGKLSRFTWLAMLAGGLCVLGGCAGILLPTPLPLPTAAPTDAPDRSAASPYATGTVPVSAAPTDTPVPAPVSTATPTATPSPLPSPTLPPSLLYESAMRDQANGDYEEAVAALQALLSDGPTEQQAREAAFRLAELWALMGDHGAAATQWERFVAAYPDDARLPAAHLAAARAYDTLGQCPQAIPHYAACLQGEPVLAELVNEWIGDCRQESGDLEAALEAYRAALSLAKDVTAQTYLRETIAGVYLALPNWEAALAEFDAALKIARTEATRARLEYMAGETLVVLGRLEEAYARYRRAVGRYPSTGSAYLALIRLVEAGEPVDEFQRGLVDYYAGTNFPDAYGAALGAFERYLATEPAPRADEALYYKALVYGALERTAEEQETLDRLIEQYPNSTWLAEAWYKKAQSLASIGDSDAAVQVYRQTAAYFPADKLAPQALWGAARLREGGGAFADAAALYEELQAGFPAYEDADEALWRAGLAHYRNADVPEARTDWQALVDKYPASAHRDAGLYWLGLVGDKTVAKESWDRLLELSPHGYYALRAQQVRRGSSLTGDRLVLEAIEAPDWNAEQAEAELLAWLRGWTSVPEGTSLLRLPAVWADRTDYRQGSALMLAGLRREALSAYDGTRAAAWKDPIALAQLSIDFRGKGLYGLAARCASRLAGLWPGGVVQDAPAAVQHLAYPLAFTDLLSTEALSRNLDPLLLAAVVRQESLFEPTAESYAGARGLGQVMPATGEGIANSLGMVDFALDDLYRPSVSVRFCAFYVAAQMSRFDSQILVALAAYHGGPGNTIRWLESSGDDLDLFVEILTAPQSRIYLERVYEQYITYESLYR